MKAHPVDRRLENLASAGITVQDVRRLRAVADAMKAIEVANAGLHDAVAAAHDSGETWSAIAYVLGSSKQAAHRRFRADVQDPRPVCPTPRKERFDSQAAARVVLAELWDSSDEHPDYIPTTEYLCRCGAWHITSRPNAKIKPDWYTPVEKSTRS